MTIIEKISAIRAKMMQYGLDAYIIPSADPHMSEYVADYWKSREWASGFTGSAGTLVITSEKSGLWTDGRYYIQAENELQESGIDLFKAAQPGVPSSIDWLCQNLVENNVIGFDGYLFAYDVVREYRKKASGKSIRIDDTRDIMSEIWNDRPPLPSTPVFVHDAIYTGLSASQKLEKIREKMKEGQASVYILGSLDSIAWLYNIRGADVANNPVVIAYAAVSLNEAILFVDEAKLSEEVKKHLSDNGIWIEAYDSIAGYISSMKEENRVFMDPKRLNSMLFNLVPKSSTIIEFPDIANGLKAVKNSCEIENIRNSQSRDGAVMVKFLIWLEEIIQQQTLTELDIVDKLSKLRQEQSFNYGDSFDAIAAYKSNAAMMHYKATLENHAVIEPEGFLLVDSGGQYLDGTTDITRTIAMGPLSDEEIKDFTLTLKSHIGLATAKFLEGTPGCNLDVLARIPMWNEGMDYKCGTGHGLGYFLSVHEGPQGLSQASSTVKLVPGMLITNEPGVYKAGKHGIRTENTILVIVDEKTDDGQFYRFETVSSCPIDKRGINPVMLTDNEKRWLNNYHLFVYETLCPLLDEKERLWLEEKTSPI